MAISRDIRASLVLFMGTSRIRALWLLSVVLTLLSSLSWAQTGGGILRGTTYSDDNVSATLDVGEPGIPGVELLIAGPGYYGSVFTDANGNYQLTNLAPGTYSILAPLSAAGGSLVATTAFGAVQVTVGPNGPTRYDFGYHKECVKIKPPKILWNVGPNGLPNGTASVTISITNSNPWPIQWVYVNAPPGVTATPNPIFLNTPIPGGGTGQFTFTVTGLTPGTESCFSFTFHSFDLAICCAERICFKVPDCDCYQQIGGEVLCNANGSYQAILTLQNLTPYFVQQIWAVGQNGVSVSPTVTNVSVSPGGIVTLNLNISGTGIDGTMVYVNIMFYSGGTLCCVKPLCIQLPTCLVCDDRAAICYAHRPDYNAQSGAGTGSYNGGEWSLFSGKTVAAVTCYSANTVDDPNTAMRDDLVFGYMNLDQYQCNPPTALGTDWALTPRGFHNGLDTNAAAVPDDCKWTKKYMGNVFAVTFDAEGNAYVAQTSCYNADYAPRIQDFNSPGTAGRNHAASPNELGDRRLHGRIFKISNITGKVTIFNEDTTTSWNGLPSGPDPGINSLPNNFPTARPEIEMSSQAFPEVGDVTFDYDNRQIFATCMDDGKLYRFNMAGQKLNAFDPWAADTGATYGDGFARWGENIWAAKYHRGRVYFSRWNEDFSNFGTQQNEVWSVAIDPTTDNFVPSSLRLELSTPDLLTAWGSISLSATAPIADITFQNYKVPGSTNQERAHMILAERGMGDYFLSATTNVVPSYEQLWWHASPVNPSVKVDAFTNTFPHRSRGLEYACNPDTMTWGQVSNPVGGSYHINLGSMGGANSSGGVDADFDDRNCTGGNLGRRNWFQSDYMFSTNYWYGLQGVALAGGNLASSIVIDLDGFPSVSAKTTLGDVEIPCPIDVAGRVNLRDYVASIAGERITVSLRNAAGAVVETIPDVVVDGQGNFSFSTSLTGVYTVTVRGRTWLCRKIGNVNISSIGIAGLVFTLPNGDVDRSGEVDATDIDIVISHFGATFPGAGDRNWDVDGSGEVDAVDIDICIANFGAMDE